VEHLNQKQIEEYCKHQLTAADVLAVTDHLGACKVCRAQVEAAGNGDAAFFNPALFHGAGTNVSTDVRRMANLLQVSSPFGRAMETVDRVAMCRALFPVLLELKAAGASERDLGNVIESYTEVARRLGIMKGMPTVIQGGLH